MQQRITNLIACGLVLGLLGAWGGAQAEISTIRGNNGSARTLIMGDTRVGITDGADPVLGIPWDPYRPAFDNHVLNEAGAIRPDGRPDIFFQGSKQWPFVVWAYNNGPDHDIAYSEWNGHEWTPTEMLTAGPEDEIDPRVFITPAGVVYITWWVNAELPYVMAAVRRPSTSAWDQPVRISAIGETAARPTVLQFNGVVWIAHESGNNAGFEFPDSRELILRRRNGDGNFVVDHSLSATQPGVLNPVLDSAAGRLYLTWKDSDGEFGCTVWTNSGWSEPFYQPLEDPSWIGAEIARISLQRAIQELPATSPNDPGDLDDGTSGTVE